MSEQMTVKSKKKRWPVIVSIVAATVAALVISVTVYLNDYYRVTGHTNEELLLVDRTVNSTVEDGLVVYRPESATVGVLFYPGAKVEYTAYAPLMKELANNGILTILIRMPCNMAIFDSDAASRYMDEYPEITQWYIAGHSMGGAMAGNFASAHSEKLEGVIFLAAYTTKDLSQTSLRALSIYGSEDHVLNMGNYEKNKSHLPKETVETVISGGCHAFFGCYGAQRGDGTPSISNEEQIKITAQTILDFLSAE